jgi:integrase
MDLFSGDGIGSHLIEYTIGELKQVWLTHREKHYQNVSQEKSRDQLAAAVLAPYDNVAADDFRASHLLLLRDNLQQEAEKLDHPNRRTINNYISDTIKIFSWGSVRDFVRGSVVAELNEIKPLTRKESPKLRDSEIVDAADPADVEAAIKAATPTIATILILQKETGARPKEIRDMRWEDINTSGDLWLYTPATHKNRHREKRLGQRNSRCIYLTQKAQDALFDYQTQRPDPKNEYIFTRFESNAFLRLERHWEKFTPEVLATLSKLTRKGGLRGTYRGATENSSVYTYVMAGKELGIHWQTVRTWAKSQPSEMTLKRAFQLEHQGGNGLYIRDTYAKAVERACLKSGVKFTPYQIRHLVAEQIDQQYGREAVAAVLGHKNLDASAIYTKRNIALAARTQAGRSEQEA